MVSIQCKQNDKTLPTSHMLSLIIRAQPSNKLLEVAKITNKLRQLNSQNEET